MGYFGEYLKALLKKQTELLTGSLIAVYLTVQPYTSHLPAPPRKVFWAIVALAGGMASFRVWRDERRARLRAEAALQETNSIQEDPDVALTVRWPEDNPNRGPLQILARNRGRTVLKSLQIKTLSLGLHSITFTEITELKPDIETSVPYRIPGSGGEPVDLLDLLMVNKPSEIAPMTYRLRADVQKQNGQRRAVQYALTYAPMHNPRKTNNASEIESMICIEQV